MRKSLLALFTALITLSIFAAPTSADALVRLGVDGRWVPFSVESIDVDSNDVDIDIDRALGTWGLGARALIGPDAFALGVKANFLRHSFDNSAFNYSEMSVNGMLRAGIPTTPIALFAEGGILFAFDYVDMGWNIGGGIEYNVPLAPTFDFNLGLGAQYANLTAGSDAGEREVNDTRLFAFVGFDFNL